ANAAEASRINRGVQQKRKTSHQLGVDAMRLPNGEQVHRGDRVLVSVHDAVRGTRTVLGTVNSMQFGRGVLANASVTVELDGPAQASTPARGRETVTVAARDFPQLQLGYAATAAALRGAVVESAYVLLPEGGRTPETIQAMLNAASKNVSLYGVQAYYGPQLDAGQSQAARQAGSLIPDDYQASAYDARRSKEATQQQRMEQHIQQQRKNDEQLQLSWQQSFTL
ncbi:MAG TPA: hypothetical protein PKC18_09650, partial [Lacipirellulaceae bacterium]|nr:hypothetical protein [Lacipirellulaceae bacterium]